MMMRSRCGLALLNPLIGAAPVVVNTHGLCFVTRPIVCAFRGSAFRMSSASGASGTACVRPAFVASDGSVQVAVSRSRSAQRIRATSCRRWPVISAIWKNEPNG